MSTEADDPTTDRAAAFRPVSGVNADYREATERLANASVAKHIADQEFDNAMRAYAEARGAARARGLPT